MLEKSIAVGMAEIHVARSQAQFACFGMGSCVSICALDPLQNVGGIAHVMLPHSPNDLHVDKLGKFADTALPELIARMRSLGADENRIVVAIVGGALVAKPGAETCANLQIGDRNVKAVQEQLSKLHLRLAKTDTGGNLGRAVQFDIETGVVRVRTINHGERQLCSLREAA